MNKPVFDIISENLTSVEWLECSLVMEVSARHLYYVVLKGKNALVALRYYQFDPKNNQEITGILDEIKKEDIVLQERMKDCVVIYNYPENCLVPSEHFNSERNKDILDLMHGNLKSGSTYSEEIKGWDIYNVYRLPDELHSFFQRYFLCKKSFHYYSVWLECLRPHPDQPESVSVIFYPNEILAAVVIGSQLQLVQSFSYKTAEDIAWHLLNLYKRFGLNQSQAPLFVEGMIAQNSPMYEELLKYFLLVNTYSLPEGLIVSEQFTSFPQHFFSPLLKLAVCVL